MKVTYYVASSIDGYIAKENGDVSWLDDLGISMEETGYDQFFSSVDGLVMGRNTYDFVFDYGTWPYKDKPTWVCSSTELNVMEGCHLQKAIKPRDVVKEANELGLKHLWLVGGGKLAGSFIQNKLLTHLSISQMPIILGTGIKVVDGLNESVRLKAENIQRHQSSFTQLEFEIEYV